MVLPAPEEDSSPSSSHLHGAGMGLLFGTRGGLFPLLHLSPPPAMGGEREHCPVLPGLAWAQGVAFTESWPLGLAPLSPGPSSCTAGQRAGPSPAAVMGRLSPVS